MPTSGRNALANCIQRVEVVGGMLDTPDFEPQCFTDDSGTTFFGIWELNGDQITLNFYTVDAAGNLTPYVPTSQPVPCAPSDVETDNLCWLAIADGVGYSTGDQLTQWFFWDVTTDPPTLNGTAWFNNATGLTLAAAPLLADLVTCDTSTIGWAVDLCDTIVQPPSVVVDSYPGVQGQTGNWQIMNGGFTVDYDVTAPSESADILTGSDGGIAVRNTGVPNDGPVVVTVPAAGIDTWSIDVFDLDLATLERVMFDVAPIAFTNALQIDPFTFEGVGDGLLSQFTFPGAVTVVTVTRPDLNAGEYVLEQVTINPPVVGTDIVPFQRCYEKDASGTVTVQDLDYDGNPYVVQGDVAECISGSCCDEDAVYQHKVFDIINGATWTPADLPAGIELIEFSFSVILNAADNGVINFDATPAGNLPVGYSVHGRVLEGGTIEPPQIIDSGTAGRILVDATWRLP